MEGRFAFLRATAGVFLMALMLAGCVSLMVAGLLPRGAWSAYFGPLLLAGFGLLMVGAVLAPGARRSGAAAGVAGCIALLTYIRSQPEALVPFRHFRDHFSPLGWLALAVLGIVATSIAAQAVARANADLQIVSAVVATLLVIGVIAGSPWGSQPGELAAARLDALRPIRIVPYHGAPVRVTEGLEVVFGYDAFHETRRVGRVSEVGDGDDPGGALAITRVGDRWIIAPALGERGDWAGGTAYDATDLQNVSLTAADLSGRFTFSEAESRRAIACAIVAIAAMLGSVPWMRRARRLGRAVDLTIDEHGGATTTAGAPVRLTRPLPSGDAFAWSVDPAVAAYRDDAHPVVDAVPGSRAEALGQAADRAVALQVLALGAIATGFGVMAFAPNHSFMWPF